MASPLSDCYSREDKAKGYKLGNKMKSSCFTVTRLYEVGIGRVLSQYIVLSILVLQTLFHIVLGSLELQGRRKAGA